MRIVWRILALPVVAVIVVIVLLVSFFLLVWECATPEPKTPRKPMPSITELLWDLILCRGVDRRMITKKSEEFYYDTHGNKIRD